MPSPALFAKNASGMIVIGSLAPLNIVATGMPPWTTSCSWK